MTIVNTEDGTDSSEFISQALDVTGAGGKRGLVFPDAEHMDLSYLTLEELRSIAHHVEGMWGDIGMVEFETSAQRFNVSHGFELALRYVGEASTEKMKEESRA